MRSDEEYMKEALSLARCAADAGEVPVGALIVRDGEILSRAFNRCETEQNATAHAELLAITEASRTVGSWRLEHCTLYVTMEPCPMCASAAIHARVGRIVFGTKDARAGACGSLLDLPAYPLECHPECTGGIFAEEARGLLRDFFASGRGKERRKPTK